MEGEFSIAGDGISGWARDSSSERPLWVELLADGVCVDIALANLPEPDNCGFRLLIPPVILEQGGSLQVRVANSDHYIGQAAKLDASSGITGEIFLDRGLTIGGWAADSLDNEKKLEIIAWSEGKKIASVLACKKQFQPREADGHAFVMHLPASLADGRKRSIKITDGNNRQLPGSPVSICVLPANVGDWLESQENLDTAGKELAARLLRNFEKRWPGIAAPDWLAGWKNAFPFPRAAGKTKISLSVPYADSKHLKLLSREQRGVEIRPGADKPEYVLLAGQGDILYPDAISHMLKAMRETEACMVYADGEDSSGQARFRPAWDKYAFLEYDYLGPILATAKIFERAEITPRDSLASARLKLALAADDCGRVAHLPYILARESPPVLDTMRREVLGRMLQSRFAGAAVNDAGAQYGICPVRYGLRRFPRVSIIIPTRDHADLLRQCLRTLEATDWPDLEYIIVDNGTRDDAALALLDECGRRENFRVMRQPGVFNYAGLNNAAAKAATGELICLLNNDTEILSPGWLRNMASLLLLEGANAGCVGAKLLWPNGQVQHGGVVVGTHQLAAHVGNQWLEHEPGYMNRNLITQQYSAVTAACLLTPRELFLEMGGFDGHAFPVAFNDTDYCLRLRGNGKRVFWTPHARLLHHESASRGKDEKPAAKARANREMRLFRARWGDYQDPFYNPNLPLSFLTEPFYGLAFPPGPRDAR